MDGITMLFIILCVVVGVVIIVYNGLIQKRMAVRNAWSQIDVQLKRRHDLVPNLVETVKGYAKHEQETLQKVMQARNSAVAAAAAGSVGQQSHAENVLSGTLRQLLAVSENYPDLKANQNFLSLQEEIVSTENRISFARQHYNDSSAVYNTALEQFPGNVIAGFGSFKAVEFYEIEEEQRKVVQEPPRVSF